MKPTRIAAGLIFTMLLVSSGRAERVGLTETLVDTARPLAYRIERASDEFHAAGEIRSLMQSFVVEGGAVAVDGRGTYEVQYDGGLRHECHR